MNLQLLLDIAIQFAFVFIIMMAGCFLREQSLLIQRKIRKLKYNKIFISAFILTFAMIGVNHHIVDRVGYGFTMSLYFIMGMSSNTVIENLLNGNILKIIVVWSSKSKDNLSSAIKEVTNNEEEE